MIRRLLLYIILLVTLIINPQATLAQTTSGPSPATGAAAAAGNPTAPTTAGGGTCDLSQYKDSMCKTESGCKYTDANSIGATGKYQFMPGTAAMLKTYQSAPASCKQMAVSNSGLATDACKGTQEAMMDEFTLNNLAWLKKNCPGAVNAVNSKKQITGYQIGQGAKACASKTITCTVSWSGLLAGAHLGGAQGVCNVISTGKDRDDLGKNNCGKSVNYYVCEHKDLPVPGTDCTPQQYPSTTGGAPAQAPPPAPWQGNTPPARSGIGNFNSLSVVLKYTWVAAFQLMTSQLSTTMMQQVEAVGAFFDAKHQLETQRLMQEKYAQAHKDYHPSLQMCEIGTFVRNLGDSERRADLTQTAMSRAMLDRALASGDVKTMQSTSDEDTRLKAYITKFCSIEDNAKQNEQLCKQSGDATQVNADINFTQTIDAPLTLTVNLLDTTVEKQEENLFAFLDYIFMNDRFPWMSANKTILHNFIDPYQDMRSLIAMRSVAQNSFAHIIAEKTQGPDKPEDSVAPFLKALMREMGMEDKDIEETLGKNPSYFAQMEVLSKKIYQHPEFISNLYDKPANVKRIRAAMTAIKLMQDRDIHEALMRREMLMSMLLELQLRQKQQKITIDIQKVLANPSIGSGSSSTGSPTGQQGF